MVCVILLISENNNIMRVILLSLRDIIRGVYQNKEKNWHQKCYKISPSEKPWFHFSIQSGGPLPGGWKGGALAGFQKTPLPARQGEIFT